MNSLFGSRVAVLAGDFLFAQSSWFLAQLENLEVRCVVDLNGVRLLCRVVRDPREAGLVPQLHP